MRALFLTGTPSTYMAPPQLADEQIVAGPDWPDAQTADGRWISLRTPVGNYELSSVLTKLPPEQKPDVIISLVDASWRNTARNVAAFRGPKVLLVADTHHLNSPLMGMFQYAATEPYDRIVFLYDRHHLGVFQSVGFRNLYWFPGLTLPHDDAAIRASRSARREFRIAFVGQAGKFHPQRNRLLEALRAANLPLDQRALPQRQALNFCGSSLLGFNASLNGDLNLRVFETLASGAALLTDQLAPESGLLHLFADGRELITYRSAAELAERAAHALAHPKETAAIGAAGAAWFDLHCNAAKRRADFSRLVFDGTPVPLFSEQTTGPTRVYFNGDTSRLLPTMMVYEGVQEMHRSEEKIRIVLTPGVADDVAAIFSTLPRTEIVRGQMSDVADIAVFTRDDDIVPATLHAPRVWCSDAQPEELAILNDFLAPAGFQPVNAEVAVLCRQMVLTPEARIQAAIDAGDAQELLAATIACKGNEAAAIASLTGDIVRAPQLLVSWHALGLGFRAAGRVADAVSALVRATMFEAVPPRLQVDLAEAALELGHGTIAADAAAAVLKANPRDAQAQRLLAEATAMKKTMAALGPRDLLICHEEVTHRQGTGVLLQRLFPESGKFVTVRSRSFHGGKVEFDGIHFSLALPELSTEVRKTILCRLLAPYRVKRILAVPYFSSDFEHALVAKALTRAPLCTFAMDDQTIYCPKVLPELARMLFAASDLCLAISPEMAALYEHTFKVPFHFMPPVLSTADDAVANHWTTAGAPANRVAMLGNVWTAKRFAQLREFVRVTGWTVDWYGPGPSASWIKADVQSLAVDGIHCRGFLPEGELIASLAGYAAVLIPSGMLDATEDNEAFSRLSLPSRMLFVLVKTRTPMLVLGSPETAAGRFLARHALGRCTSFDPAEAAVQLAALADPVQRIDLAAAADRAAAEYVLPRGGEWIWASLARRQPAPAPFNRSSSAALLSA